MGRKPCCDRGVNRGSWSVREDKILANFIKLHGEGKWRDVPKRAGLNRCGKSCRLRWLNYLRPDIKRGNFSEAEEDLIIRLHTLLGNRWSLIAGRLPGRTDNEIKNFWNTNLSKRAHQMNRPHNNITPSHPHTSSQPNTVIQAKPVSCTKKIVFPDESNVGMKNTTTSACETARDLTHGRFSAYGVIEDFDVDGLLLPEDMPQQLAPGNKIDDEEVDELVHFCEGEHNNEANNHQNWMVGQLFDSVDDVDVDFSFLNLQSDSFMDFDPSHI